MDPHGIPESNLKLLAQNPYPGRFIAMGVDDTREHCVQVYAIMGRSDSSRNRIFEEHPGGMVRTAAADPSKLRKKDIPLIIYSAMREQDGQYIVSNGNQTDTICKGIARGLSFVSAASGRTFEPDKPNYTPRISAAYVRQPKMPPQTLLMHMVSRTETGAQHRRWWEFELRRIPDGEGYCFHTYEGDGNPLPSFRGEPYPVPLRGNEEDILLRYRNVLNAEHLVSIAVKMVSIKTGESTLSLFNKYDTIG
jgi:IMP cyclohydrolase